jgi:hypothetical protein
LKFFFTTVLLPGGTIVDLLAKNCNLALRIDGFSFLMMFGLRFFLIEDPGPSDSDVDDISGRGAAFVGTYVSRNALIVFARLVPNVY